jgi:hypothetical protein
MNAPIRADIELRGAPGESARPSEGGQELPFAGRGGGELRVNSCPNLKTHRRTVPYKTRHPTCVSQAESSTTR